MEYLLMANRKLPETDQAERGQIVAIVDKVIAERDERARTNGGGTIETFTAESLMSTDFPEIIWVVPELLPPGAALLCGKPKFGKSWLALGLCIAVGYGSKALSHWDVPAGEALYIALEDPPRRLKTRLTKLLEGEHRMPNVTFWTSCPRLSEGGTDKIREFLEGHPDASLVVVDTLEKIRDPRGVRYMYESDYLAISCLKTIADHYNVAMLMVHHLRKGDTDDPFEQISGTYGLQGAADTAIVMRKEKDNVVLFATGRDLEKELELAIAFDHKTATWKVMGDAETYRLTQAKRQIALATKSTEKTATQIANELDQPLPNIRRTLSRMYENGDVQKMGKQGKEVLWRAVP
jgi:RecA-family ATPase